MSDKDIPQVGKPVEGKQTSEFIYDDVKDDSTKAPKICWFNGAQYTQGAVICSAGLRIYCRYDGSWGVSSQTC